MSTKNISFGWRIHLTARTESDGGKGFPLGLPRPDLSPQNGRWIRARLVAADPRGLMARQDSPAAFTLLLDRAPGAPEKGFLDAHGYLRFRERKLPKSGGARRDVDHAGGAKLQDRGNSGRMRRKLHVRDVPRLRCRPGLFGADSARREQREIH